MAELLQVLHSLSWSTWFAVFLGFLAFVCWLGVQPYSSLVGSSPLPGPVVWPWVGSLPDVFRYGGLHKMLLNYFYKYGRVYKMSMGRSPSIVVTDPEILKQIMVKEFWKFTNRPPFVRFNPPLDAAIFIARVRHTLIPTFTASKLKQMLFLPYEPAKKAEINISTARDTTGPGF